MQRGKTFKELIKAHMSIARTCEVTNSIGKTLASADFFKGLYTSTRILNLYIFIYTRFYTSKLVLKCELCNLLFYLYRLFMLFTYVFVEEHEMCNFK